MLYYFRPNVILLSIKCYITFDQMLYYFRPNVILLSTKCYITFNQMLYYFQPNVILLSIKAEGPFAPKPSHLSGHELARLELSQEASGL